MFVTITKIETRNFDRSSTIVKLCEQLRTNLQFIKTDGSKSKVIKIFFINEQREKYGSKMLLLMAVILSVVLRKEYSYYSFRKTV